MIRPCLYGLLIAVPAAASGAEKLRLTVHLESINYSEATSLRSISGEWDDKVTSGDDALSYSRAYVGFETETFSIQYLQRFETVYEFDNDTARFIYRVENQLDLVPGRKYRLDIRPKRAASEGIRLGFTNLPVGEVNAAVFVSLLKPSNLLDGDLDGSAVALAANDYDFNFESDLFYKRDPLFERDSQRLSGSGYALDLTFDYAINDRWHGRLELVDVAGELRFNDAPFTTATAASDVKTFDANGYVVYDPVVRGFEGNRDYTYEFDMHSHLALTYLLSERYRLQLLHHEYASTSFQELRLNHPLGGGEISWQLLPGPGAAGVAYTTADFRFGLAADDLDFNQAKYLALQTRYSWTF